jgi:hypothetical protein
MFGIRRKVSRRGRLSLFATFALLVAIVIAVPGISNARAAVKQYLAKFPTGFAVSGSTTNQSFTLTITDCGGTPLESPCTLSSTIQIGTAQVLVPTRFSNVAFVSATSPNGRNWTGSWDGTYIQALAVTGADKLNAGEKVNITFTADVSGCQTGSFEFTTTAWGSTPTHSGETFSPLPPQPSVSVNGCNLGPGENATGPNGTNITNDSDVTVGVSFGDNLTCNSPQWSSYHLPDEVTITPPADPGTNRKAFTFRFSDGFTGGFAVGATPPDSSFYLICYSPTGSGTGTILPQCPTGPPAVDDPACVDQQYRDITTNKVTIRINTPPEDPRAH